MYLIKILKSLTLKKIKCELVFRWMEYVYMRDAVTITFLTKVANSTHVHQANIYFRLYHFHVLSQSLELWCVVASLVHDFSSIYQHSSLFFYQLVEFENIKYMALLRKLW